MSKFDTHGGYFAPKDYMRVNEGGSHEENPNGGVQVGMDPEGNPNLLEENEPVYKDYVYSDNIYADGGLLEKHVLPKKYANKLYSWIADDIISEAEERPLDATSRNGLEVLLGRLAEAQEEQKQMEQQKELEEELANLSPEELDELEAMLAQQEQVPQEEMAPEQQMQPELAPEQMALQQPAQGMPIMCNGGFIRKFDQGGSLGDDEDIEKLIEEARNKRNANAQQPKENPAADEFFARFKLGARRLTNWLDFNGERKAYEKNRRALARMLDEYASGKDVGGAYNQEKAIRHQAKVVAEQKMRIEERDRKERDLYQERNEAQKRMNAEKFPFVQSFDGYIPIEPIRSAPLRQSASYSNTGIVDAPLVERRDTFEYVAPTDTSAWISGPDVGMFYDEPQNYANMGIQAQPAQPAARSTSGHGLGNIVIPPGYDENSFKCGGRVNRFDGGGWADFLKLVTGYSPSSNAGGIPGTYSIDRNFGYLNGNKDIFALEQSDPYKAFTNYVISHADDPNVRAYLELLDKNTGGTADKLFVNGQLRKGWDALYTKRRNDQVAGIYHLNPEDIGFLSAAAESQAAPAQVAPASEQQAIAGSMYPLGSWGQFPRASGVLYDWAYDNPTGTRFNPKDPREGATFFPVSAGVGSLAATSTRKPSDVEFGYDHGLYGGNILPTWPRYSKAIAAGLLGMHNVFTPADRYNFARLNPQVPEGRIHLQNQVYNPIDQNIVANAQIAQGNATSRALRNSGLGSSTAQAVLAADNNLTGSLGTGFIQTWDANNQRRNAVIAANNQAEGTRAQFDYGVDQQRKAILNDAAYKNANIDMMKQRLNYAADAEKYQAIGNEIDAATEALSNIGRENFEMNQINSNRGFLGYGTNPAGWMTYNPNMWQYANPYLNPLYYAWLENEAKKNGNS